MAPHSTQLRHLLITQPGAGFLLCQAVYDWLLQSARATQPSTDLGIIWRDGGCWANAHGIHSRLPEDARRHTRRSIGQTLRRFGAESESLVFDGLRRRYWRIDLTYVRSWAGAEGWGDEQAMDEAIEALNKKT